MDDFSLARLIIQNSEFQKIAYNTLMYGIVAVSVGLPLYRLIYKNGMIKNGLIYNWFNPSSLPTPAKHVRGHLWSTLRDIKLFSNANRKKKRKLKVSNFAIDVKYNTKISKMPTFLKRYYEKTEIYFDPHQLTKGVVGIGSAGSGKSVFILNIMQQDIFPKSIFFSKKGDFEQYFYRPSVDILLAPFSEKGAVHDILSEKIELINTFIKTLSNAALGKKQDFFKTSSEDRIFGWIQNIKIEQYQNNISVKKSWEMLLNEYNKYAKKTKEGDSKSEKDVLSSIKVIFDELYIIAYKIIELDSKTFVVKDYFDEKKRGYKNRLFLSANDNSAIKLLSASFSVIVEHHLSMQDINNFDENFLTAYFLDEYLSLAENIDKKILDEISRVGRSKGITPFKFLQDLPAKAEERNDITSNYQYLFIFAIAHSETIELLQKMLGEVEYIEDKESKSYSKSGTSTTQSEQSKISKLLSNDMMNSLEKDGYQHFLFAPKEKLLIKCGSPIQKIHKRDYINIDREIIKSDFYKFKKEFENQEDKIDSISDDFLKRRGK